MSTTHSINKKPDASLSIPTYNIKISNTFFELCMYIVHIYSVSFAVAQSTYYNSLYFICTTVQIFYLKCSILCISSFFSTSFDK